MSTERPGVYAITHVPTGRRYVGSTSNLSKRWSRHRRDLVDGAHRNAHLQATWSRDGADAFRWDVLAIVEPDERIALEQRAIDLWDLTDPSRGFNRAAVAGVSYGGAGRRGTGKGPGANCGACGAVKDGTYLQRRVGKDGHPLVTVLCQECVRRRARNRQRRKRGVPVDWPHYVHYHRRGGT